MPGVRAAKTHIPILDATLAAPNTLKRHGLSFDLIRPPLSVGAGMLLVPYKSGYKEIVHAMNLFSRGIEYYTRRIVTFILTPMAPDMLRRPYSPWLNLVASATAAEAPRI